MPAELKVLIYEPGTSGHRPVYLRYIKDAFAAANVDSVIVTQEAGDPKKLVSLAKTHGCRCIFICTMDGLFFWLIKLSIFARLHGTSVAGIYYLFNNLYEGWKGVLWRGILRLNLLHTIFVPDLLYSTNVCGRLKGKVRQIPDVWDRLELKHVAREEGLKYWNIENREACVFLVLGALSVRKGIGQLLWSLEHWDHVKRPDLVFLFSGKTETEARKKLDDFRAVHPDLSRCLILRDQWLSDEEICHSYGAASYLCAVYPKTFKVSISTAIKAFAMRRPVIVGAHGMIGALVRQNRAGLECDVDDNADVLCALERAYDLYRGDSEAYEKLANAGTEIAERCELTNFKKVIIGWVTALTRRQIT